MAFYYEQRTMDGRWTPVKAMQRPSDKTAEGRRVATRGLVEIMPGYENLSLDDLRVIYSPDGMQGEVAPLEPENPDGI